MSLKTHDVKFSVDLDWHKSKKTIPVPHPCSSQTCSLLAATDILESKCGSPEGLQALKADSEIKLSRCAGLASHSKKTPQKICQEGKECLLFAIGTKQIFLAKQTFG